MKHIELFESFNSQPSPEELEAELVDAVERGGDHVEIADRLKRIFDKYPGLIRNNKNYAAQYEKIIIPWLNGLSDQQKLEVKLGKKSSDYTPSGKDDEKEIWADFLYVPGKRLPREDDLSGFDLRYDTLPDGTPRYDERGFSVVGKLYDVIRFSRYLDIKPTYWGGVYPGTDYAKNGRKYDVPVS